MKEIKQIKEKLDQLFDLVRISYLSHKDVLTFEEAVVYTGRSPSNLYKLTSDKLIPHYKSQGKKITFKRTELDAWMLRNRVQTQEEIDAEASAHVIRMRKAI